MGNTATSAGGKIRSDSRGGFHSDGIGNQPSCPSPNPDRGRESKAIFTCQQSIDVNHCAEDDGYRRARASTTVPHMDDALPTVFKWEGGGKEVSIAGTFSDWKPIKMCSSHGDFVTIINVPEGIHEYKFIVDGSETVNNNSPKNESSEKNVIHVKKSDFEVFEALAMDLASNTNHHTNNSSSFIHGSPPGDYSQHIPQHLRAKGEGGGSGGSAGGSGPPILPPHLLQVILNNPNVSSFDSTLLPQPNHVMLNHLYALSIKDGVMVLSCTHRYRKKYVTTLLYKPI